jgi:hypothetical protein
MWSRSAFENVNEECFMKEKKWDKSTRSTFSEGNLQFMLFQVLIEQTPWYKSEIWTKSTKFKGYFHSSFVWMMMIKFSYYLSFLYHLPDYIRKLLFFVVWMTRSLTSSFRRIVPTVLYFWIIFWWWLWHCIGLLVPTFSLIKTLILIRFRFFEGILNHYALVFTKS